jgi:hypothetical protein
LERNWDVIISLDANYSGYSGHPINESWWAYLKPGFIEVNAYSYFITRNTPNNGYYKNVSDGESIGTGINSSSSVVIRNIIQAAVD